MASEDHTPVGCPTCSAMFLQHSAVRGHHQEVHDVSLAEVPPDEWERYVHERRAQIRNPAGVLARERAMSSRHPAYRAPDD